MRPEALAVVAVLAAGAALAQPGGPEILRVIPESPTSADSVVLELSYFHPGCFFLLDPPLVGQREVLVRALLHLEPSHGCPSASFPFEERWKLGRLQSGRWTAIFVESHVSSSGPPDGVAASSTVVATLEFEVTYSGPPRTGTVEVIPSSPASGGELQGFLRGTWSDTCLPRVESFARRADTLVITARGERSGCEDFETSWFSFVPLDRLTDGAYRLRVDVLGSRFSAPGVPFVWAEGGFTVRRGGDPPVSLALIPAGDPAGDRHLLRAHVDTSVPCTPELRLAALERPPGRAPELEARFVLVPRPGCPAAGPPQAASGPLDLDPGEYRLVALLSNQVANPGDPYHPWAQVRWPIGDEPWSQRLRDRRFKVEVSWNDGRGGRGKGQPVGGLEESGESALFSFFDRGNWELLAKLLDGCALNGHFWVFLSASTDVEYELEVLDTWSGERRRYRHEAGAPAPAVTDTRAFPTCGASPP